LQLHGSLLGSRLEERYMRILEISEVFDICDLSRSGSITLAHLMALFAFLRLNMKPTVPEFALNEKVWRRFVAYTKKPFAKRLIGDLEKIKADGTTAF
jgi:hypothetical protein